MTRSTKGSTARKLKRAVVFASAVSVLLACGVFGSLDWLHRRQEGWEQARLLTSLTASRLGATAAGSRVAQAGSVLGELRKDPEVVAAWLTDADGNVVATFVWNAVRAEVALRRRDRLSGSQG